MDKDYICENYGDIKVFTQIKVTADLINLDSLCEIMSAFEPNILIEDYSDIDLKSCYGDLIDETLLNADKTIASVSVYIADDDTGRELIAKIRKKIESLDFECKIEINEIREEDWANSWRNFYEPIKIGERISILPAWIEHTPNSDEITISMDPGMAFGTGSHETTRLVIGLLEKYVQPGKRVLDVGTGSGILAICAAKLGAQYVCAYDIDPVAVQTASENCEKNGVSNVFCGRSDLLAQVDKSGGKFDLILANIVADIIIRMAPDTSALLKSGGVFIMSGIIDTRADDVISALSANGYEMIERVDENGWCAFATRLK